MDKVQPNTYHILIYVLIILLSLLPFKLSAKHKSIKLELHDKVLALVLGSTTNIVWFGLYTT
ncbi:uncharacterized protein PHALS_03344 [Plasmopara halstedii]|uniref:Uncharacterized protein n=1 Tax=Plasmopara halstedii TaxID=4781 RepID=A0A0P1A7M7_PLAHL|nr:uncharacterized protein PHALS_03344 [Plasmopara halstedii]CEG36676.1 hypothetical protein PHALS_03344 [Plasmopara halstedii]|eukprot:XP_024573045.1 hypothetical protein PHALS_03344 [Plasmopara halstedii]